MNPLLLRNYGLHAFLGAALVLFLGFLYVFNFTTFFGAGVDSIQPWR